MLREFGLPREALGWSLFSFNFGVEIGQLAVVLAVASLLTVIRRRSDVLGARVAVAGSVVVIAAGTYWFVQRVFFPAGSLTHNSRHPWAFWEYVGSWELGVGS